MLICYYSKGMEEEDSATPTEQEILASVFYHCDEQKRGLVTVSQILNFLHRSKPDWDFGELETLLDPNGENPEVDLAAYQVGISQWVQSVRSNSVEGDDEEEVTPDSSIYSSRLAETGENSIDGSSQSIASVHSSVSSASVSANVLEGESNDVSRSWDFSDAVAALQESQLRVKHLVAENEHLHQTIAASEEQNTTLISEVDELKNRVVKLNAQLSRNRKKLEEQHEASFAEEQHRSQASSDRVIQLEKEKAQLEMSLTRSEDERMQLTAQLESFQEEYHSTIDVMNTDPLSLQKQLHDTVEHSSQLESRVSELSTANIELHSDNRQLKSMLADFRDQQVQPAYGSPLTHSTPMRREASLHDELVASQERADPVYSPLFSSSSRPPSSSSEMGNGMADWTADVTGSDTERVGSFSVSAGGSLATRHGSSGDLMSVLSNVRQHFQAKKTLALRQLTEMSESDSATDDVLPDRGEGIANFSLFESKLAKLVSSRKAAVEKASKLEKAILVLREELERMTTAKEMFEHRATLSEEQATEAMSSLQEMRTERDQLVADVDHHCEQLKLLEHELAERTTQYEELLARFKDVPDGSPMGKCEDCSRVFKPIDEGRPPSASPPESAETSQSFISEPPTSRTSPVTFQGDDGQAIAGLLKGLPSEYNLLRVDAGTVEQHYRNISDILQDLCESAEGCPDTTRRAKEDAEVRLDWCTRQLDSLASSTEQPGPAISKTVSTRLTSQLKCAIQQSRLAGRSEQDFLYLSLIKVLIQYINLLRLEVFLPSLQRSRSVKVLEVQGKFSVSTHRQSVPRSTFRWPSRHENDQTWEDKARERSDSTSRSSRMSSSPVTSVFHESSLSHHYFGDVFPPQPALSGVDDDEASNSSEQCDKVMTLVERQMDSTSQAQSRRTVLLGGFLNMLLLFFLLLFVVFAFLTPSLTRYMAVEVSDSIWSLLPLEQMGAQYTLAPGPIV